MPWLDSDRKSISMLNEHFDPSITCAEPGCGIFNSFKTEWTLRDATPSLRHSIFDGTDMDQQTALEWFRERKKLPWFCNQHNGEHNV